ncbi:UNVERIFIED_CONTAM: hypothetical protein FKN15_037660 [Acipenser sinensis]
MPEQRGESQLQRGGRSPDWRGSSREYMVRKDARAERRESVTERRTEPGLERVKQRVHGEEGCQSREERVSYREEDGARIGEGQAESTW